MQNIASNSTRLRGWVDKDFQVDANLPPWARRTNPIVRQHLGRYWRVMPPQIEPLFQWYLVQVVIVLLSIPAEFVFIFISPMALLSLAVFPVMIVYYGRTLYDLASDSSRAMVQEIENHTMPLLLTTPMSLREVLLSKISGAMWRQSDPISLVMATAAYTQLPTLLLFYINMFPSDEYGIAAQILILAGLASSIVRIPLEVFMVSVMGQFIGSNTPGRGTAAASTLGMVIFYFIFVNLPRFLPLGVALRFFFDVILPLILPVLIAWVLLRLTENDIYSQ